MKQQINLYQPMFRKQEKIFSAVAMAQVLALLIAMLSALYVYSWWSLQPFDQQLVKVRTDKNRLQTQLNRLEKEAGKEKSRLLEDEVRRLNRELEQKRRVVRIISSGRFGNREGFAPVLEGLARRHINGLWLTRVSLENGGEQLALSGMAISSELVPLYIQRLAEEPALKGLSFNVLEIKRSDEQPTLVRFDLATRLPQES